VRRWPAPEVFDPLTRYQCCPPTCGAAAAVSARGLREEARAGPPVVIAAQAMTTDFALDLRGALMRKMVGYDMAKAAKKVYEQAGIGPEDVHVVELHDCFTANELITYEALGLCPRRRSAEKFIVDGDNTYGGKVVTNPSGGLLSKGHPLGATGLAQCTELVWQLRGRPSSARSRARARAAAQPGARRRLRRDALPGPPPKRSRTPPHDRPPATSAPRCPPFTVDVERGRCASSPRPPARPTRSTPTTRPPGPPATRRCRCRRPSCSAWRWTRATRPRCASKLGIDSPPAARRAGLRPTTAWPAPATG
jgi:hypothetical protein